MLSVGKKLKVPQDILRCGLYSHSFYCKDIAIVYYPKDKYMKIEEREHSTFSMNLSLQTLPVSFSMQC